MELLEFKKRLLDHVLQELDAKIREYSIVLSDISKEKASETKSVMGDKHETSRVMMQREEDQLAERIKLIQNQRSQLAHLHSAKRCPKVETGSVVWTSTGIYCISIPFGKVNFNKEMIYFMSSMAPLAISLLGKKNEDKIFFNQKEIEIRAIC